VAVWHDLGCHLLATRRGSLLKTRHLGLLLLLL
jgi:hypothetical protein